MAVTVDQSKCTGCGRCAQICPMGAITIHEVAEIDVAQCVDCCVCVGKCPHGALALPGSMTLTTLPAAGQPVAPAAQQRRSKSPNSARPFPTERAGFSVLAAGGMLARIINFFRPRSGRGRRRGRGGRGRRYG